jgi:hypothetical protein
VRITVFGGIDGGSIRSIGEAVSGVSRVFLQPINTRVPLLDRSLQGTEPPSAKKMIEYRAIMREFVERCEIRGTDVESGS